MQSIAIAVCTLLGLGMLLFGSDFLDRHLTSRAAGGALGARRDPAALVTAALTPTHVAPAPRSAARSAARAGAIEATAHEVPASASL